MSPIQCVKSAYSTNKLFTTSTYSVSCQATRTLPSQSPQRTNSPLTTMVTVRDHVALNWLAAQAIVVAITGMECQSTKNKKNRLKKYAWGSRKGKSPRQRTRRSVEAIYHCLGPTYFRRAYRMTYESFLVLHEKLKAGITHAAAEALAVNGTDGFVTLDQVGEEYEGDFIVPNQLLNGGNHFEDVPRNLRNPRGAMGIADKLPRKGLHDKVLESHKVRPSTRRLR